MNSLQENKWIKQLVSIFEATDDRYKAHDSAKQVMGEMTKDKSFLHEVIRKNLSDPKFLKKKRHYSTMAMEILQTKDFHLVVNIYPSLPDGKTDISFQNIHHHGDLLLTTIAAFGPGYSSLIFEEISSVDGVSNEVKMKIKRSYKNNSGNIEFIDIRVPHIVFYPETISATYALWSNVKKRSSDNLKQIPVVKKIKKPLSKLISWFGAKQVLGINSDEYSDIYVENGKFFLLKSRINYEVGSNENFIQNILSFIQKTGFEDMDVMKNILKRNDLSPTGKEWIHKFINKEPIPEQFESIHLNIEKVNLKKADIEEAAKQFQ